MAPISYFNRVKIIYADRDECVTTHKLGWQHIGTSKKLDKTRQILKSIQKSKNLQRRIFLDNYYRQRSLV
jgi:hypothetical protein